MVFALLQTLFFFITDLKGCEVSVSPLRMPVEHCLCFHVCYFVEVVLPHQLFNSTASSNDISL